MNDEIVVKNKKKEIYLILFVVNVIIVGVLGVMFYSKSHKNEDISEEKEIHVPLDVNYSIDDESALQLESINVYDFKVEYYEDVDKWSMTLMIKNTTDNKVNIEDDYHIILYDKDNVILKETDEKFMGVIEPHDEILIGMVLDIDGSLINSVKIKKI